MNSLTGDWILDYFIYGVIFSIAALVEVLINEPEHLDFKLFLLIVSLFTLLWPVVAITAVIGLFKKETT